MRRRIMAGNWKMYKTAQETADFFRQFNSLIDGNVKCDIVLFPPSLTCRRQWTQWQTRA